MTAGRAILLVNSAPLLNDASPDRSWEIISDLSAAIIGSPVLTLAGLQVLFMCTETHELGEELVASYLYQVHLYDWLERNDYGRFLADNDL